MFRFSSSKIPEMAATKPTRSRHCIKIIINSL
ncbi:hypothetical protein [Mucilaginibacter sp.]